MRLLLSLILALTGCSSSTSGAPSAGSASFTILTVAVAGERVFIGGSKSFGREGSFSLVSMTGPRIDCSGTFRYHHPPRGRAVFTCSNGESGMVRLQSEGNLIGSGEGSSTFGPVAILFGHSLDEVNSRLPLPPGARLAEVDGNVRLIRDSREGDD